MSNRQPASTGVSLAWALIAALLVCGFSWLAGFNFNSRGVYTLLVAFLSCWAAVVTYYALKHP